MDRPIEIFFSYAREDEDLMNDVRRQLVVYERKGRILKWHDRQIPPGSLWREQIDRRLEQADVILLFVSPHFIESRYCYELEGQAALRRQKAGDAVVVPVILRPCSWEETLFSGLQSLPRDGNPITRWADRDEACLDVAKGVMALVDELLARGKPSRSSADSPSPSQPPLTQMGDVASMQELSPVSCTSPVCRSSHVELTDSVEISSLKAENEGWNVHGIIQMDYSVDGQCHSCGRLFQVVTRQIPVQFPELACNECERRSFLQYKVQELKKVAGGFEFAVEIRCSGCRGRKKLTQLLTGMLRTLGINIAVDGIKVSRSS